MRVAYLFLLATSLFAQGGVSIGTGVSIGGVANNFGGSYAKYSSASNCNVVGDKSTDDTAAIQACLDAAPDDSMIVFPSGAKMKITSTINIHNRYGLLLWGQMGRFGGPSANTAAPTFYWYGADGGKMFDLDRADNIVILSLTFFASTGYVGGTGGANIGINVDMTISGSATTTYCQFERVTVVSGTANPNFQAILFAQTSGVNVEAMTVRDSNIFCSYGSQVGQGLVIGPGGFYNAKKYLFQNNTLSNCSTAIYLTGGSADILNNKFNLSTTDIHAAPVDAMQIEGNDSENSTQFFTGVLTAPIVMSSNRIAATSPPMGQASVWITIGGASKLTFQGNKFDDGSYMPVGFASNAGGSLDSSGNDYGSTNALAGFYTTPYNLTSRNDSVSGFISLMSSAAGPAGHIGGMNYEPYSQRWTLSNEVSSAGVSNIVSEPSAGLSLSNLGLGTCASSTGLSSNSTGRQLTSALTFSSNDAGGFVAIAGGSGFTAATYYILSGSGNNLNTVQSTGSNGTGGTFVINRGRMVMVQGSAGVADTLWVCAQTNSGYSWKQIF